MKHFCSLSEAIREGAKLSVRGSRYVLLDSSGGTCAIGAGAMAIGLPTAPAGNNYTFQFLPYHETLTALRKMYPYLSGRIKSPARGDEYDFLNVIADLFDVYDWKRAQIADWLEERESELGYVTLIDGPLVEKEPTKQCTDALNVF